MHILVRIVKSTTFCRLRSQKLQLWSLKSHSTNICNDTQLLKTTDSANRKRPPQLDRNQPCHCYISNIPCMCASLKILTTKHHGNYAQIRHCSRCTFVDGKIPDGFRTTPPWRVLFFGTDQFSLFTLKQLNENRLLKNDNVVDTLEVVSNKEKTLVRKFAEKAGLKVHDWPYVPSHGQYDVGVLASFGHLIPGKVLHKFPYGILNVHPSLLPRWRGASPIEHTILNGDRETGISIMELRPKHFDIGPLLLQHRLPVPPDITYLQLHDMLGPIGAELLIKALYNLPTLEKLEVSQPEKGVTYAHKFNPTMAFIDWENQTSESINRQYRALHETIPLRSFFGENFVTFRDMVFDSSLIDKDNKFFQSLMQRFPCVTPGMPFYRKNTDTCWIKCKDDWVGFKQISVKNKTMSPDSFYNGYIQKTAHKDTVFKSHKNHLMETVFKEKTTAAI